MDPKGAGAEGPKGAGAEGPKGVRGADAVQPPDNAKLDKTKSPPPPSRSSAPSQSFASGKKKFVVGVALTVTSILIFSYLKKKKMHHGKSSRKDHGKSSRKDHGKSSRKQA
eukprot:GHVP01003953.1.p1 GENE.GHVP01003953.1~~GHVP01003953.1.p1  ORF type:complete len:111 (-),score=22.19 GHVP01003953.1:396-728(-)